MPFFVSASLTIQFRSSTVAEVKAPSTREDHVSESGQDCDLERIDKWWELHKRNSSKYFQMMHQYMPQVEIQFIVNKLYMSWY